VNRGFHSGAIHFGLLHSGIRDWWNDLLECAYVKYVCQPHGKLLPGTTKVRVLTKTYAVRGGGGD
jgi:hypothetical protein